jgi:hypothetical protein
MKLSKAAFIIGLIIALIALVALVNESEAERIERIYANGTPFATIEEFTHSESYRPGIPYSGMTKEALVELAKLYDEKAKRGEILARASNAQWGFLNFILIGLEALALVFLLKKTLSHFPNLSAAASSPLQRMGLVLTMSSCLIIMGTLVHWSYETGRPLVYLERVVTNSYFNPHSSSGGFFTGGGAFKPMYKWPEGMKWLENKELNTWDRYDVECANRHMESHAPKQEMEICLKQRINKSYTTVDFEWRQSLVPSRDKRGYRIDNYASQKDDYQWWWAAAAFFLIAGISMYRGYLDKFFKWMLLGK